MLKMGQINRLEIYRMVDFGAFLTDNDNEEVLLPRKFVPEGADTGSVIDVFLYLDSEDRPVATTQTPKAMVGETAFLTVVDVTEVGAFMDWGLDKDLFVPFREQKERMVKGESYPVRIVLDKVSGRIFGSSRFHVFAKKTHEDNFRRGDKVDILVCSEEEIGFSVLIGNQYMGMLYKSELRRAVKPGDRLTAYISKLRDDKKIDVSLRKPGFSGIIKEKPLILEKLGEAGGFLPFNAQSSPEEIEEHFHISKRVFKQAIGNLYKEHRITVTADGIKLNS
ncbi:MAG: S1-like domain-containing RNA-binding protein [Victivallaceae bacterium]|nr:S1-like domain-containing RNA-binding protein [Victivallaceae bacterium]